MPYKSYTRPYMNRTPGRPGKMKKFNAPLPKVTKAQTKQAVATPSYVRKAVRRALKNHNETKHVIAPLTRQTLYHNGGTSGVSGAFQYNFFNNLLPTQGDNESSRDGNEILVRGVRLNLLITLPFDRLASKVIMYVLKIPKGYNPLASYDSMFDNLSSNWLLDSLDTGRVKAIYKKIFTAGRINPNVPTGTNREVTIPRKVYINMKSLRLKFYDDNTNGHMHPYEYVAVFAGYDAWGTLSSDIVSYVKLDAKLYFKDF